MILLTRNTSLRTIIEQKFLFFYEKLIRRLRDPYWNTYKLKMRNKTQIRLLVLETFKTKYPNRQWLLMYSDGSYTVHWVNTGAGVLNGLFSFQLLTYGISI
jgi:hypothetical protein